MAESHALPTASGAPAPHSGPNHPYHLVNPSPWPLVGSIAGGVLAAGMVVYMHYSHTWLLILGVALVLATMFGWWRDVIHEAEVERVHNPVVVFGLRFGMSLFIVSEVKFFVAFFWAFFHASLDPTEAIQGTWPPPGIQTFDPWELPLLNTLILLLSGVTVTWAHHSLLHGDRKGLVNGLACTVGLGVLFSAMQAYEYSHAAFGFTDGIYPSTFYMATGFHGFHVIVGTCFLAVCLFRAMRGHFTPDHHFGFEAAAWYWHFVDAVWLFLFVCIYWWGG